MSYFQTDQIWKYVMLYDSNGHMTQSRLWPAKSTADEALENQSIMYEADRIQCAARRITVNLKSGPTTNKPDKFSELPPTESILSLNRLYVMKWNTECLLKTFMKINRCFSYYIRAVDMKTSIKCSCGFGGLEVACWTLVQTRPKPSDFSGRKKKILSTPSFGREVKPFVPCRIFVACKRARKCMRGSRSFQSKLPAISSLSISSFHY